MQNSRFAQMAARRRFPTGPGPGGRPQHMQTGGAIGQGPGGGYGGLDEIMAYLGQGINQSQFDNLAAGHTGGFDTGSIGGMKGAFSGLSPAAVKFLTSSGLLERRAAPQQALQSIEGLAGPQLFQAQLMNSLIGQQNAAAGEGPATYGLHEGVDQNMIEALFGQMGNAYQKGFNEDGRAGGLPGMKNQGEFKHSNVVRHIMNQLQGAGGRRKKPFKPNKNRNARFGDPRHGGGRRPAQGTKRIPGGRHPHGTR